MEWTARAARFEYIRVEYVFSAYSSNDARLVKGRLSMYFSRVLIKRSNQNLIELGVPPISVRSDMTLYSRIMMGSFGGFPANVLLTASRQNCIRNWPMVGLDTSSGSRTSSRLKARNAS